MSFDIAAQIESWRTSLLDTTRRNRLINFKTGRSGGVPLVHPDPGDFWKILVADNRDLTFPWKRDLIDLPADSEEGSPGDDDSVSSADEAVPGAQGILDRCRHSPRLRPDHLLTDLSDARLAARLARLALNARESQTEHGVTTLFVAFGFLRWFESDASQVEIRSPLLLVPVRLDRDSVEAPWRLQAEEDEILPNHTLAQRLLADFRLRLPTVEDEGTGPDEHAWRTDYLAAVERCGRNYPRWEVLDEAALGVFNFQKLAMWEDLGRNRERIQAHDLCRAIAGDHSVALRSLPDLPGEHQLDERTRPDDTFHILDADSSQHAAVLAAARGASLVLDGPPGTGKSQTIANTIAEFLAAGKTVLFVSEKAAALEVVKRRLDACGLGDFCLELHSHKANKRSVLTELGRCLSLTGSAQADTAEERARLVEARSMLNGYVRELHAPRSPLGLTAYQAHGEVARLHRLGSKSRCPVPRVLEQDAAFLRKLTELLARLPDCRSVFEKQNHPWRGCRVAVYSLTLRDDARHHLQQLAEWTRQAAELGAALHEAGFGPPAPTLGEWSAAVEEARRALACPLVPPGWFGRSPREVAEGFIRLDDLTRRCRELRAMTGEFVPEALRRLEPASASALIPAADKPAHHLRPRDGETLRTLRQRLARAAAAVRLLQRRAAAVQQATQQAAAVLGSTFPPLAVKSLPRFASVLEGIARMPPVRPAWWDTGHRTELQATLARCREETDLARKLRTELAARLSPKAFAPEAAALAAECAGYGSFLARLFPRWWAVRRQASAWYTQDAPNTSTLLGDARKLAEYHRRVDYCRQVEEQYASELLPGAGGRPDREATQEALAALERLEQMKISQALRAAVSEGGRLDRQALLAAVTTLSQQTTALLREAETLGAEYDLGEIQDAQSAKIKCNCCDLAAWLDREAAAVERAAGSADLLVKLLAEGQDLPAADVPAKARTVAQLVQLRSQVAGLSERLGLGAAAAKVEGQDWGELNRRAVALIHYLDTLGRPLSPQLVQLLTSPEQRIRVGELVNRSAVTANGLGQSWQFLVQVFDPAQDVSTGITIDRLPLVELHPWLASRARDAERIREWILYREIREELTQAGVLPILDEIQAGQVKLDEAAGAFRVCFLHLWLDALCGRVSALRQFRTEDHERLIERFRALDRHVVDATPARIRHRLLTNPDRPSVAAGDAPGASELGTLLREVNKKRRHMPLRKLFAALPSVLPRLKPCLMMSPLAVSTYLDSPDFTFDLVIFDEASQVRPHDAVCAIYRGRQLVVAGDQKQLPPTSFFERSLEGEGVTSDEDDAKGAGISDFESVLDVCCTLGLPRRRLRWHYRSRREGLIAFSNRFVYDNDLVTFPSAADLPDNPAVTLEYIEQGRWKGGAAGGFNAAEARRTAEQILEHFEKHPDKSLGVIAFNQAQQMRILAELEHLRQANPHLEGFFRDDRDEPFFVKNLENVQGDERDVIFLSVGYGPDEAGKVSMNFGPLNRQGGERRLNVAVTRARERMRVFSSLRARDIDLSRTGAAGARLLRSYLDYAERGPEALRGAITEDGARGFDSPFEQEVHDELARRGLHVHRQVGCSGYRIDLALVDPRAPGRYLLGVECDGATYHSSATARDRDRLRQEVLEDLGWRICRVWSTDWVRDPGSQVQRVLAALDAARRGEPAKYRPRRQVPAPGNPETAPPRAPATAPPPPNYASIDDVPEQTLRKEVLDVLRSFGATPEDDLPPTVARQLGFKRAGRRIQARIEASVEALLAAGEITRTADRRLQVSPKRRATSP